MSGGIDSTIAACLLKRQGFDVLGITMQIWDGAPALKDAGLSGCYSANEPELLQRISALAGRLAIRHAVIPLADEYQHWVLDYFRREYLAGRTPNPCVICNWKLKFSLLPAKARALGFGFENFATGHYARTDFDPAGKRFLLRRGGDAAKDQSYFLYHLEQEQLRDLLFPLGGLTKQEVRQTAAELGLTQLVQQQESRDFIPSENYPALFGENRNLRPGPVLDSSGRTLGEHKGIIYYTIGQRKGIGLSGLKTPLYVIAIDAARNAVIVGPQRELLRTRMQVADINWIWAEAPHAPLRIRAKIRRQHQEADAVLTPDPHDPCAATVLFDRPQMAITPGQAAVFYDGDLVLGGGTILADA